ncbi:ROK family transcriptional regulator [Oryzobacter sp. R7]|uniref:ROK family transcriptional regulator n=1 Tax=Oryzobacter faecalis TaxID=3388656 RepID=UPI00398CE7F0
MSAPPSTRRGSNLPRVGDYNQVVVLDAIRRHPEGVSRTEVATLTGLSPQAVSNICRRLIDLDLVVETDRRAQGPGKPRTPLTLRPGGRFAVGVHLDPAVVSHVLLDLTGAPMGRSDRPLRPGATPEEVLRDVVTDVERLVRDSGVDRARLVGVGVAAPGPVDHAAGALVRPPNLPGWDRVEVRGSLARSLGLPVLLDKDVVAAAVGEVWAGGVGHTSTAVFLYLGTGVGAGLVVGGEVHRGVSGNAGEVGHLGTGATEPACWCGLGGCLGEICSPGQVVRRAVRDGIVREDAAVDHAVAPAAPAGDPRHPDQSVLDAFAALCDLADAGDTRATGLLEGWAAHVAKAVADLVDLLDADQVVFGGPLWERLTPTFLRVVPGLVRGRAVGAAIHPITVRGTGLGPDVAALGAASLALDDAFTPRSARLLH